MKRNPMKKSYQIEEGIICAICHEEFMEENSRPMACENCGGDGVLATYENQHQGY